jgi:hypothetical protein
MLPMMCPVKPPAQGPQKPEPISKELSFHAVSTSSQAILSAQGKAETQVPLFSEQTQDIVAAETKKTLIQDGGKAVLGKSVSVANRALLDSSARLGQIAARRATRALSSSVPIVGATISAVDAKGDFERAKLEAKTGNKWAALAFKASGTLNGIDASLGVVSAGSALTGAGLAATAAIEMVGWASTAAGFVLGVGGEYLSIQQR